MVTKPPNFVFNLLFMTRVPLFKGIFAFSNILSFAFSASAQINDPSTVTVYSLSDSVSLACAGTLEMCAFVHDRTGHLTTLALVAAGIWGYVVGPPRLPLKTSS